MDLYLIRSTADQVNLSPETIRSYCDQGLLDPIRDSAGRRLFTNQDIERIREIRLERMDRRPPHARASEEVSV